MTWWQEWGSAVSGGIALGAVGLAFLNFRKTWWYKPDWTADVQGSEVTIHNRTGEDATGVLLQRWQEQPGGGATFTVSAEVSLVKPDESFTQLSGAGASEWTGPGMHHFVTWTRAKTGRNYVRHFVEPDTRSWFERARQLRATSGAASRGIGPRGRRV